MGHNPIMSRVVFLHIGSPETGTAELHDRLAANSEALAACDVTFPRGPLTRPPGDVQYRAALDLLGTDPGGVDGHWDALMRKVRRSEGTVVIGHELLAAAPPDRIAKAMADLDGSDVHVVLSARDLARQLPAYWQESIKHGRRWTFAKFLEAARRDDDLWFWRANCLPKVLSRWGAGLEPDHVHLVTVPQGPFAPEAMWERFSTVLGVDPACAPVHHGRVNPSMGVAEAALVRRLNRRLVQNGLTEQHHTALVREILVHQNLAQREGRDATLPPELYPWVGEVAQRWVDWAVGSGIDVVGDVEELRPVAPPEGTPWLDPDKPDQARVVNAALDALVAMTEEAANRADPGPSGRVGRAARRLMGG